MFKLNPLDNQITVIQGDTGILDLSLQNYQLKEGDKVYFTVKKDFTTKSLIFKEVTKFTDGKAKFMFNTKDTTLAIGMYFYDVQCNLADGRVDTIIRPTKFQVLGGITDV